MQVFAKHLSTEDTITKSFYIDQSTNSLLTRPRAMAERKRERDGRRERERLQLKERDLLDSPDSEQRPSLPEATPKRFPLAEQTRCLGEESKLQASLTISSLQV